MLKLLLLIPIIGCIPLMFIKNDTNDSINLKSNSLMKQIALSASLINLLLRSKKKHSINFVILIF